MPTHLYIYIHILSANIPREVCRIFSDSFWGGLLFPFLLLKVGELRPNVLTHGRAHYSVKTLLRTRTSHYCSHWYLYFYDVMSIK